MIDSLNDIRNMVSALIKENKMFKEEIEILEMEIAGLEEENNDLKDEIEELQPDPEPETGELVGIRYNE